MLRARLFLLVLILFLAVGGSASGAETQVKVIAGFSTLGDMVKHVGEDRIEVITPVGPNGDAQKQYR